MSENSSKKPFYKKWWVWVIVIFIIAAAANGANTPKPEKVGTSNMATASTTEQKTSDIFKLGDKVKLGDYILVVNSANDCSSGNQFIKPDNGNKFVTIDITQENDGADPRSYNSFDFKLQDDKDFTYSYHFISCKDPAFGSGDLQKGQKTRGYLTFQIPKNNKPAQLMFSPSWFSSDQITINLQ